MHPIPPPPDQGLTNQWLSWLLISILFAANFWRTHTAGKTADAAKTKADTTELRVNGHADSIQQLQTNQLPPALASDVLKAAASVNAVPGNAEVGDALAAAKADLTTHADMLKAQIAETPLSVVLSPTQQMNVRDLLDGIAAKAQASAPPVAADVNPPAPGGNVSGAALTGGTP